MRPAELFRFVASRAPRPRRPVIDLSLVAAVTPFLRTLLEDLAAADAPERAPASAAALLADRDALPHRTDSHGLFDRLERLHDRFLRTRPTDAVAAGALVVDGFDREPEMVATDSAFAETVERVRDAVLALKLRPEDAPDLLARYVRVLQAAELVRRLVEDPDAIDFSGTASALTVALTLPPEFAALAPKPSEPDHALPQPDERDAQVREIAERLSALDRAVVELTAHATELELRDTHPERDAPARLVLAKPARARLSAPTRSVLETEAIDLAATGYTAVLDALEGVRAALLAQLGPETDDQAPVRLALGSLVLPSPSGAPALPWDPTFLDPSALPPSTVGPVRPSGVGQLLVVREQIIGYEGGELSHAENVMRSESRSRSTRRLRRTEETFLAEQEESREEERDLQTTERFELLSEISNTLASSRQFEVGASISAGYGPFVQVEAHTGFKTSSSSEQVQSSVSRIARETTERAASRVAQRVRTRQTRTTLEEFEEHNSHGFDNTAGDSHSIGLYQWLDRVYELQVYDYGVRLLFEFTVPEPATMYLNALESQIAKPEGLKRPKPLTRSPGSINANNYRALVAEYRAENVAPPPPPRITLAQPFGHTSPDDSATRHSAEATLVVPPGYRPTEVRAAIQMNDPLQPALPGQDGERNRVDVLVADRHLFRTRQHGTNDQTNLVDTIMQPEGDLAVAISANNVRGYAATVTVECTRTSHGLQQWQLQTYAALAQAAAAREAEYREALATAGIQQGVLGGGRNPLLNRVIERNEIKRASIAMITGQWFKSTSVPLSPQAAQFAFERALRTGRYAQFWETAIDWHNLSYTFHPYYWARQNTWGRLLTEDSDPVHAGFIAAGAATVRLAVAPGFEAAVLHFLETGAVWSGGELPAVTREDFVAFLDEIEARRPVPAAADGPTSPNGPQPPDEVPVGEPWQVRLPTTLVRLRPDASLPRWKRDADGQWHAVEPGEA